VLIIVQDTGMRPSEIFRLRWKFLNWHDRVSVIPFGKTRNSRRMVPMSERVARVLLKRMPLNAKVGWVFPSTTVAKQFEQARSDAGLPKAVVLYCTRHTFGTCALEKTGNLAAVMKALGARLLPDLRIMSRPKNVDSKDDQRLSSEESGKVRQNPQPPRNQK
jgi:integrase